jgi:hypothetical protein
MPLGAITHRFCLVPQLTVSSHRPNSSRFRLMRPLSTVWGRVFLVGRVERRTALPAFDQIRIGTERPPHRDR